MMTDSLPATDITQAPPLQITGLTKSFGDFVAVDNVDITVGKGEIVGLVGPNGAGKSTAMSMILGLIEPTHGSVSISGLDPQEARHQPGLSIGFVPERQEFYEDMRAWDYVRLFADLHRCDLDSKITNSLFRQLGLWRHRLLRISQYSMGMRRKLSIIRAIAIEPNLLLLDEPVANLDPRGVVEIRNILFHERDLGRSIMLSSHLLPEVEQLVDRVIIMDLGRVVASGTVSEIKAKLRGQTALEIELATPPTAFVSTFEALAFVREVTVEGEKIIVDMNDPEDHRLEISTALAGAGAPVIGMREINSTLEDVFLEITGVSQS